MDKATATKLGNLILAAVNKVLADHGYQAELKGGKFTTDTFEPKVVISSLDTDLQKNEFLRYAQLYKLQPTDYGVTFCANRETYTLVGLRPSSPRFPVIGKRADGKTFKFTTSVLTQLKVKA